MNIAFGHTYTDIDCLGSLLLVKRLFPEYRLVKSNLFHPAARKIYNLYQHYFDFLTPEELRGEVIDRIIIVDTCVAERVKEYFNHIRNCDPEIRIIDHHNLEKCDILGATLEGACYGANVTYLGKLLFDRGITLQPEEATIALTGIYADTGRFTYGNVSCDDFEVAGRLLSMGASLKLVKSFLDTIIEDDQIFALNALFSTAKPVNIQGHSILTSYLALSKNVSGLAAVVDKIMDVENPDAYFAFFYIARKKTLILIARSQKPKIDLHELLLPYGGGGHQTAASVTLSNQDGPVFYEQFLTYLEHSLRPATRAQDIMTRDVLTVREEDSLSKASLLMEEREVTGVPVLNTQGTVTGFISLRDISKGRKAGQMEFPVKTFMSKNVITSKGFVTMREVERLFYKHHIGHLPIVEDGRLLGIVSRWDFLQYKKQVQ